MKRMVIVLPTLLAACLLAGSCSRKSDSGSPATAVTPPAQRLVASLAQGDYAGVSAGFDDTMKKNLSADQLRGAWESVIARNGAFQKQAGVRTAKEAGYDMVYVTCAFARGHIDVKMVFNAGGQVSGLWFVPASGG